MSDRLLFIDFETSVGGTDLTVEGHVNYVTDPTTEIRLLALALGDEEPWIWLPGDKLPTDIVDYIEGGGPTVAWNAQFDRWVWQQIGPEVGLPKAATDQFIDAMAQASASGLPAKLDAAGQALGLGGKLSDGKAVMLRCGQLGREKAPKELWDQYEEYACRDVALMRDIWQRTMPLAAEDWRDYHVNERINDRGLPMDMRLAEGAARYHAIEQLEVHRHIREIAGEIKSQFCSKDINKWVLERISKERRKLVTVIDVKKTREARKKDRDAPAVRKTTLQRKYLGRLRDTLKTANEAPEVVELLDVLEWGRSASGAKFQKIVDQSYEGRLYGAYVFNGAGQTGRYSSRGVQWHNTPRARVEDEALELIRRKARVEALRKFGPLSRTLSRAARPTIRAGKGHRMVWADYSAIEARVLPWLAHKAGVPGTGEVLEMFREGVDVYVENAAEIFGCPVKSVEENQRQAGKVAVLALGYAGGKGAYAAMASGYGLTMDDEQADRIVKGWRDANRWSLEFNDRVWVAVCGAMSAAGSVWEVGVVSWQYVDHVMGGTLVCTLPSGRTICYPKARMIEEYDELLEFDVVNLRYGFGAEKSRGWTGTFVENITQAAANDVLRNALAKLDEKGAPVVGHTHDDIILHSHESLVWRNRKLLIDCMLSEAAWMQGLPLKAETEDDVYYHK